MVYNNKLLPKKKKREKKWKGEGKRGRKLKKWDNGETEQGSRKKEICLQAQQPLKFNLSKTFLQTCPDFYPVCPYI